MMSVCSATKSDAIPNFSSYGFSRLKLRRVAMLALHCEAGTNVGSRLLVAGTNIEIWGSLSSAPDSLFIEWRIFFSTWQMAPPMRLTHPGGWVPMMRIRRPATANDKQFKCDYPGCEKSYYQLSSLIDHQVFKHGRKRRHRTAKARRSNVPDPDSEEPPRSPS